MLATEILIAAFILIIFVVIIAMMIVMKNEKIKLLKNTIDDENFSLENYEKDKGRSKRKKIIITTILSFLLLSSFTIFFTSLHYKLVENNENTIVLSINSESMATALSSNIYISENNLEGKIYKFDVVEFNKVSTKEEIKLYDVILYEKEQNDKKILVAHRIIKINNDGTYEVRGDNNLVSDCYNLEFTNIKGVFAKRLPFASFINYITYMPGFYITFTGCVGVIVVILFFDKKEKNLIYPKR